jgi:hypothetical protein
MAIKAKLWKEELLGLSLYTVQQRQYHTLSVSAL